jgi:hypothetical protein
LSYLTTGGDYKKFPRDVAVQIASSAGVQ